MDYNLTQGIAWSKAASKVKGPFNVQCTSCGRYVSERALSDHLPKCAGRKIKDPREATAPHCLVRYQELVSESGGVNNVKLHTLSTADKKAFKEGLRIIETAAAILTSANAICPRGLSKFEANGHRLRYIKDRLQNLPRNIARGVEYELRKEHAIG